MKFLCTINDVYCKKLPWHDSYMKGYAWIRINSNDKSVGGGGKERLRSWLPQSVCGHGKTNFELFTFIYVKIVTHKYIDL